MQENIKKFMVFNKRRRWSHSSRVKLPLVDMSASWFLVSTYLIWILESKFIRSSNQSCATLWVLDTCLIVGLLPFMIILITASLSFYVQLRLTLRRMCVGEYVIHMRQLTNILVSLLSGVGICASDCSACLTSRHLIIDLFNSTVISHCLMGVL